MEKKALLRQQLNTKMLGFVSLKKTPVPPIGWIKTIRSAIGMSLQQLGDKLNISKQGVLEMERREKEGAITLKSLREVAKALDMQLVYGFVPNADSLDALIEKRAKELATQIVMRTAATMKLEDQANSEERIQKAIEERTKEIIQEMPKMLWD